MKTEEEAHALRQKLILDDKRGEFLIKRVLAFYGGYFSNWAETPFEWMENSFPTSEHAFMWAKAMKFNDFESADLILRTSHPRDAKALGRKVENFREKDWTKVRFEIMSSILVAKFSQHDRAKTRLRESQGLVLVEASPWDKIWGVGHPRNKIEAYRPCLWDGWNLLGFALMNARTELFG